MDREITIRDRRQRTLKRWALGLVLVGALWAVFVLVLGSLRPGLSRSRIVIAAAERGPVEAVIEAAGTVVPLREKVVSSPIDTRVVRVLKRPGEAVRRGDALLELDTETPRLDLERIEDRLAQKRNEQLQLRLALERELDELHGRIAQAELDEEILRGRHERNVRMSQDGLVSSDALAESSVQARKAGIALDELRRAVESAERGTANRIQGLELDLAILQKEAREAGHRLELATMRSDEDAVLTWIVPQEGAPVHRGDVLARVAKLDAFRVEATVSDVHATSLAAGLPVRVLVDEKNLSGTLSSVYPEIEAGAVRFAVELDEAGSPLLRRNRRVDVLVVTGVRADAVRLRRGPFFRQGGAAQEVFVVEGDHAVRRQVALGLSGRDFLEIVQGLEPGEQVIVSDMTDYLHLEQVRLR